MARDSVLGPTVFLQQEMTVMSPFTNMSKRLQLSMGIGSRPQRVRAHRRRFLPGVHAMEDRTLLSTLLVMNNQDSGSGSLRAEIAPLTAATPSRLQAA